MLTVVLVLCIFIFVVLLCGLSLKREVGDAGKLLTLHDYLIALKPAEAPEDTIEKWHLRVGQDVPAAAKYFAHESPKAVKVHAPLYHLLFFLCDSHLDRKFFTSADPSKPVSVLQWLVSVGVKGKEVIEIEPDEDGNAGPKQAKRSYDYDDVRPLPLGLRACAPLVCTKLYFVVLMCLFERNCTFSKCCAYACACTRAKKT